ncbi:class 1b ribonucleoside-diphosphate reductase subunit beta [Corynebacterium mastitidis]|uniref:class 1b ribonucleoside-diphosphate reductase subunit beta n=1 Tax=Corynebacterium mastitidis TaxID=161890 RepID=UPI003D75A30E
MHYMKRSILPSRWRTDADAPIRPINWNLLEDPKDTEVWRRLTSNFWLPEKVPLSNDLPAWQALDPRHRALTVRVFTGLTLLDTVQATVGEPAQIPDARTEQEQAVYTNIAFMQSVHARSYSSVFSTLCSTREITEAYAWAVDNPLLQRRATTVLAHYHGADPLKRKAAATVLSSLLLYAGFYLPLWFASRATMLNTADMIRLILRDKAVHGYYSGYKYQRGLEAHPERAEEMRDFTHRLVADLLEQERRYSSELYDLAPEPTIDGVMAFVHYNANKALMNLGYAPAYEEEAEAVEPEILAALTPDASETHDFFSGSGSSYVIGATEPTEESDWDF